VKGQPVEPAEREVRAVLVPTDDIEGWRQRVLALDPASAVPVLAGIVLDPSESLGNRKLSATILGMLKDPAAIPALLEALRSPEGMVKGKAADALGEIGRPDEDVVRELLDGLDDDDDFVRGRCAVALGRLRRPEAVPALERVRDEDRIEVNRELAAEAMEAIRGASA